MSERDDLDRLRLTEHALPTSRLVRLMHTGRSAVGLVRTLTSDDAPDLASLAGTVAQLGQLKGVAMKAGQMLSYLDARLPPEVQQVLGTLQRSAVASPFSAVEQTLRASLGARAPALLATLERTPVAVASIGQVHRATLPDGTAVAVKVRHPGIEQALAHDFELATASTGLAGALLPGVGGRARDAVREARTAFLEECDFTLEARRQAQFGAWFADDDALHVPPVFQAWSGPAVLTTGWRAGLTLEAFVAQNSNASQAARDRAGAALFRFALQPLAQHGVFHADPHPGNCAFSVDGSVTVYDFGCVRAFPPATVRALRQLVLALRQNDRAALRSAGHALGFSAKLEGDTLQTFERFARGFFAPVLASGPTVIAPDSAFEAQAVLRDKRALLALGVPGQLLFLFRIRFGLYAVLARLGARCDWGALEASFSARED